MTAKASHGEALPAGLGSDFGPERAGRSKPRYRGTRPTGAPAPPEAAEGLSVAPVASQAPARVGGPPLTRPSLPAGLGAAGIRGDT
jgi:hypothetical protein